MINHPAAKRILEGLNRIPPLAWLLLAAAACYVPAVFFGRAFFEFDSFTEGYAYAAYFAAHSLHWLSSAYSNGYQSGANVVFNPDIGLFGLLMTLIPPHVSDIAFWNAITGGFFVLFAWVSYVFFRDRSFDAKTSAALAAFVVFSQRFMTFFSSWIWVAAYSVFPAACVVLKRYADTRKWQWIAAGALVVAFAAFFAQPGILVFLTLPLGAYALFLVVRAFRTSSRNGWRVLGGFVAMAAIGLLLSAWYVLPMAHLMQDTPRNGALTFADAQVGALLPTDVLQLVLPHWSLYTSAEPMLFMAVMGFVFAVFSFARPAADAEERFWRWTLLLTVLFAVRYSPLAWLAHQLPVLNSARGASRMLFAASFAMALLAGRGIVFYASQWESIRSSRIARWTRRIVAVLAGVIVVGAMFDALGGFRFIQRLADGAFDRYVYPRTTGLPLAHYHDVIASMVNGVAETVRLANPFTLIVLAGLAAAAWMLTRHRTLVNASIAALLGVTAISYGIVFAWNAEHVSAAVITQDPSTAQFIRAHDDGGRYREDTLFFGSSKFEFLDAPSLGQASPEDQYAYARDLLAPNANVRYGVQTIDGYDNFASLRTSNLLDEVLSEAMPTGNAIARKDIPRADKIKIFNDRLNVLGMMNVKYILSAYELPTSTLSVAWTGETTSLHIPIRIYENPLVLPRVFLAPSVTVIPEDEAVALSNVLTPGRDFKKNTVLECTQCQLPADLNATGTDRAQIVSYLPGDVTVQTSASGSRLLVLSENRLRGWQATLDGAVTATYFANDVYQGVIVPPGAHVVRFRYTHP